MFLSVGMGSYRWDGGKWGMEKKIFFFSVRDFFEIWLSQSSVRGTKSLLKRSRNGVIRGSVWVLLGWKAIFGVGSGNFSLSQPS